MYESPRDTLPQLKKFLVVLAAHRAQLEQQMADGLAFPLVAFLQLSCASC